MFIFYRQKGSTCVYANPMTNFYWQATACSDENKFLCEKKAGIVSPQLQCFFGFFPPPKKEKLVFVDNSSQTLDMLVTT